MKMPPPPQVSSRHGERSVGPFLACVVIAFVFPAGVFGVSASEVLSHISNEPSESPSSRPIESRSGPGSKRRWEHLSTETLRSVLLRWDSKIEVSGKLEGPAVRECFEGFMALYSGDYERAANAAKRLRKLGLASGLIDYILGAAQLRLGHPEIALAPLESAVGRLRGETLEPFAFDELGYTYEKLGRYTEAISAYKRCMRLGVQEARVCLQLAHACYKSGNLQDAVEAYTQALTLDPTNTTATLGIANVLTITHDYERALAFYNRAAVLHAPTTPSTDQGIGVLRLFFGRYAEAKESLIKAVQGGVMESVQLHVCLFISYGGLGEYGRATTELQRAMEIDPWETTLCYCSYLVERCRRQFPSLVTFCESYLAQFGRTRGK